MKDSYLYQRIAESIQRDILQGNLKPGDRLPSVRQMTALWDCTLGTVQRAYQELAHQGLILSRPGLGTRVANEINFNVDLPLRKATLVNRAEAFLLEVLTNGYTPSEIEQAVRLALDRWRSQKTQPEEPPENTIRFCGSHDLALDWVAMHFPEIANNYKLQLNFSGSLGGLISLAEDKADLAGCHLWDEKSNTYNVPFIQRLLPGQEVALLTLCHRRLGLVLRPGNPHNIQNLVDLLNPNIKFINRQKGSGTRVWLDTNLKIQSLNAKEIPGYDNEKTTHSEIARAIAEQQADVGIGLETAAIAYGLDFIFLTLEPFDLVIPKKSMELLPIKQLIDWINFKSTKSAIASLGGYDIQNTGSLRWI